MKDKGMKWVVIADLMVVLVQLDKILHLLTDEKLAVETIQQRGFDLETIRKVEKLVKHSKFKRLQMAPALDI